MASTLLAGWLLLLPHDFEALGKNTIASALFAANLILMRGTGYFGPAEDLNPLLHLWSLGVEEQFYIFWPVLILLGTRLRGRPFPAIGIIGIASFAFNIWQTRQHPSANFYDPVSRFWELLLGAGLAHAEISNFHCPELGRKLHQYWDFWSSRSQLYLQATLFHIQVGGLFFRRQEQRR